MKIRLTGAVDDEDKLHFVKQALHQPIQKKDTPTGFEFTFGDHTKYVSFVQLLSLCEAEDVPSFFCRDGKFLIRNLHPKFSNDFIWEGATAKLTRENRLSSFKWILSTHFTWCLALSLLFLMLIVAATRETMKKVN